MGLGPGLDSTLSGLSNIALRAKIRDDDSVDQLHHFVTVTILTMFAALAGFVQFAGEPINCWNHGEYYQKHYQDHVNQYCWSHDLYRYPNLTNHTVLPYRLDANGAPAEPSVTSMGPELGQVIFFRWVTTIFLVQAFLFKLPNLLWGEFNAYTGSNIVKMVEMLQEILFAKDDERNEKIRQVAVFLEQWLRIHRKRRWFVRHKNHFKNIYVQKTISYACCTLCIGENKSNNLSNIYLMTKFTFLLNNVLQFVILSIFLQVNFLTYGVETLKAYGTHLTQAYGYSPDTFPIVVLCNFQTFDKGNVATGKWVQCILSINVFLEKLFLIEWFWLLFLLILTLGSFLHWCIRIFQTQTALKFVQNYMKLMGVYGNPQPVPKWCTVEQFVMEYLRNDGVFILRILAVNTNEVVVAHLVEELWKRYVRFEESPHPPTSAENGAVPLYAEERSIGVNTGPPTSSSSTGGLQLDVLRHTSGPGAASPSPLTPSGLAPAGTGSSEEAAATALRPVVRVRSLGVDDPVSAVDGGVKFVTTGIP